MKKHMDLRFRRDYSFSENSTNCLKEEDEDCSRRESAYKAVLIVSLSLTICSWTCMSSIFPLVYQFISVSNSQFNNVLEFCEDTALTVMDDSALILNEYSRRAIERRIPGFDNHTTKARNYRQALPNYNPDVHCRCQALPGLPGLPGRRGMKGSAGQPGAPGKNARLPCQPLIDLKKYCPEQCPQGSQGPTRRQGQKRNPGIAGKNGEDGKTGPRGSTGPPGIPGTDGDVGDPGVDAIPSPFVPGPDGPVGEIGDQGPPGPRGMPGVDGPQGPIGQRDLAAGMDSLDNRVTKVRLDQWGRLVTTADKE
uniref:Uncharacterized protein n=1 Tax=Ditylenchus dipsaci TaxID=166011 RepID=A0A915EJX5_9BILA